MKHIKIFEDYSEEELRALQNDLHDIGHKTKFVQGEDFGFGKDFKGLNYGRGALLRINKEMFDLFLKRGELKEYSDTTWRFVDPEKFGIPISDNWLDELSSSGQYYIETDTIEDNENIIKKLGEIRI